MPSTAATDREIWRSSRPLLPSQIPSSCFRATRGHHCTWHVIATTTRIRLISSSIWPRSAQRRCAATKTKYGDLPLHEAIKGEVTGPSGTGSPEVVKYLVELYPEAVKETNKYGEMALHIAIKKNALS